MANGHHREKAGLKQHPLYTFWLSQRQQGCTCSLACLPLHAVLDHRTAGPEEQYVRSLHVTTEVPPRYTDAMIWTHSTCVVLSLWANWKGNSLNSNAEKESNVDISSIFQLLNKSPPPHFSSFTNAIVRCLCYISRFILLRSILTGSSQEIVETKVFWTAIDSIFWETFCVKKLQRWTAGCRRPRSKCPCCLSIP